MTTKQVNNKSSKTPSLLKQLLSDIFVSHWLVTTLALVFIASSMLLAKNAHESRRLTAEWQKLRQENHQQQQSMASYRLELTSLSEADRISRLAKKQLGMVEVSSKSEKVVTL